jgi:hypothetical protein
MPFNMHTAPIVLILSKKIYKLANQQPGTGNPNISPTVAMANEIREAINVRGGVNVADVSEFFDDMGGEVEDAINEGEGEEEAVPTTVTASSRHGSTVSSATSMNNIFTAASASAVNSKAKTKTNETASNTTMSACEAYFQQGKWLKSLSGGSEGQNVKLRKSKAKKSVRKIVGGVRKNFMR